MKKKNNLITGAAVMAAASVLCKILSAVFKIPLDRFFLHEEGIAVFQSVCSVYNVFLAFCITGIPIALSGLVASAEEEEAYSLRRSAFVSVSAVCCVCTALLLIFSENIAVLLSGGGAAVAAPAIRVAAPAILFMGVVASERGFFQGNGEMLPSALSQIAESFTKAALGTILCALFIKKGISWGAAGAMAGVSGGTILSAAVLFICRKKRKCPKGKFEPKLAKKILKLSIPVTLGAFGFTAVILCDALTVPGILASQKPEIERLRLFGYLTRANTVYNLPATIITAVTASIVPLVAMAKNDGEKLRESLFNSIKLLFVISVPCGFGLMLFAPEILEILYSSGEHHMLLVLTGVLVLIMPYIQATTAVLQSMGKVYKPIIVTFSAVLVKIVLNFIVIPKVGIEGAPLSTIVAFSAAFIINTLMLKNNLPLNEVFRSVFKIAVCGIFSCGAARLLYGVFPSWIMLFVSIGMAAVLYAAGLLVSGTVDIRDFKR